MKSLSYGSQELWSTFVFISCFIALSEFFEYDLGRMWKEFLVDPCKAQTQQKKSPGIGVEK
jgi:hypothetical protein